MSLAPYIEVNTRYTRSIHLERDSEAQGNARPYLLTSRARQVLGRIADTLEPAEAPRAWALVGPYGSGKSAFGLFLAQLLGHAGEATRQARAALDQSAPELAAAYARRLSGTGGYCVVTLSGHPEALGRRLLRALHGAAKSHFAGQRAPRVLSRLEEAARGKAEISLILELTAELQAALHKAGGAGLLIVIDELGKFLEYEARHRGATEIHLLQALAEHAFRAHAAPLHLVVLLHQSFEQYAQSLGEQLRNEWKKVQGRFESVPFLETTEQTLRVVKATLVQHFDEAPRRRIEAEARRLALALAELHALPPALNPDEAAQLFAGCYPIHPLSLLLLPTLCQRVAQNERTLFSYLGSREPHGFLDSLERLPEGGTPAWIEPSEIYEYFILNQPGLVTDNLTHRRWAEVVTALERLGDAPAPVERMLEGHRPHEHRRRPRRPQALPGTPRPLRRPLGGSLLGSPRRQIPRHPAPLQQRIPRLAGQRLRPGRRSGRATGPDRPDRHRRPPQRNPPPAPRHSPPPRHQDRNPAVLPAGVC